MRRRKKAMTRDAESSHVTIGKWSFCATCHERSARFHASGVGSERRPAFSSCQTYWFDELQPSLACASVDVVLRQPPRFAPGIDFAFATKRCAPSRATSTAVGYHPVGIKPVTREAPRSRRTTDTAFVPPFDT